MPGITETTFNSMTHGAFGDETIREEALRNYDISQDSAAEGLKRCQKCLDFRRICDECRSMG